MAYRKMGLQFLRAQQGIETVEMKGLEVSLLASGDGTEVILHRLAAGAHWSMVPEAGWTAMECITILKGTLVLKQSDGDNELHPGDTLSAHPIVDTAVFVAKTDAEFLYVSSQPVFHLYSKITREMMELAVQIEEKDGYTADHCHRIMQCSMRVGDVMNLSPMQLHALNYGSFFHDIGKIKVPLEILNKPGKLTPGEWEIMKQHTVYGRIILEETGLPHLKNAGKIVEQHHERYDGKGYPHGLQGNEIDLAAAIIAVVDSYDAMTTDRVYQKGRSKEEALAEIVRCKGTMYHPDVVDAFLRISDQL